MESSREIQQRIQDFSRQLAEEFGDISWDQFGSPFEAIEVRGAEIGDMVMRGFAGELSRKHLETSPLETSPPGCETAGPDCGATGERKKLRSRNVQTIRGD